jgi:hypothetical protein
MTNNYWIKLYLEILEDSKMGRLPDRLWRRVIELFVLAGRTNEDGKLPDTPEIAWSLRQPTDDIDIDLKQIESTGIIQRIPSGWMVTNFSKRQGPSPVNERVKSYRDRQRQDQYYGNNDVTNSYTPVTPSLQTRYTESESESESESEAESEAEAEGGNSTAAAVTPQVNHVLIDSQTAAIIYMNTTGLAALPSEKQGFIIETIINLYARYRDVGKLTAYLKPYYTAWCSRRSKNGNFYNRVNPDWLNWAIGGIIPGEAQPEKPSNIFEHVSKESRNG